MPFLVCFTMVALFGGLLGFWPILSITIIYFFRSVELFITFVVVVVGFFCFSLFVFNFFGGKCKTSRLSTKVAARIVEHNHDSRNTFVNNVSRTLHMPRRTKLTRKAICPFCILIELFMNVSLHASFD